MVNQQRPWYEEYAWGQPETQAGLITPANTNFQLMRIPYPAPNASKTQVIAISLSNPGGVAGLVKIWDQDLTDASTAAGNRGSVNAPILQYNVPASADVNVDVITRPYFQTGIAAQSSINNMFYSIYVVHTGLGV